MDIAVALDRMNRRDIIMYAGDDQRIDLTVYEVDGDDTPVAFSDAKMLFPQQSQLTIPIGSGFDVPDKACDRVPYRITAIVDGTVRTLCTGMLVIRGGTCWPYWGWDYGGPYMLGWLP